MGEYSVMTPRIEVPTFVIGAASSRRLWFALLGATWALTSGPAFAAPPSPFADTFEQSTGVVLAQESMDDLFGDDTSTNESSDSAPAANPATPATDDGSDVAPSSASEMTSDEAVAAPHETALTPTSTGQPPDTEDDELFEDEKPQETAASGMANAEPQTTAAPSVKVSGFVQNVLGYTYSDPDHLSKFNIHSKVKLNGRFNQRVKWQIGGDLRYDPNYDFNNFYSDRVRHNQTVVGYVDETFIDIDADAWDFRLGRQHIIWGEMVGLFFADVVSALDLREFVLPDFELLRIPQWAVRAEYFQGDFHADFIFLPYVTGNEAGKFGADYYLFPVKLPTGVTPEFRKDKMPHEVGADSGYGARGSYLVDGWDLAMFYYTSPDRNQALERHLDISGPVPDLVFFPRHNRIHQFGATLAKDLGSVVLKAEAVETKNRQISLVSVFDVDGLEKSDELRYVLGADWSANGQTVNLQFFQTWLQDHQPDMIFRELESGMSVLLTTTRLDPNITPEILWIRSLNRNEWLLEIKASWNVSNHWRAVLGADIFEGPPTGLLGEFDAQDRVYYELRYTF